MPSKSGFTHHLSCLMYVPYLGKLNTLKIMNYPQIAVIAMLAS